MPNPIPRPRRYPTPDADRLREYSNVGYQLEPAALRERIESLPEADAFTPVLRDWWTVRLHRRLGAYHDAIPILLALLRRAPDTGPFRYFLRIDLSDALMRLGFPERSEQLIRKTMGSVDFGEQPGFLRSAFYGELGRFYRRRGQMSLANQVYERALECNPQLGRGRFISEVNRCDVLVHAGRYDEARAALDALAAYDGVAEVTPALWYREPVWIAFHLEQGDAASGAPHLARLRDTIGREEGTRNQRLYLNLEAETSLVAGRHAEARERYEHVIDLAMRAGSAADMMGNLMRGYAECLLHLGDPVRADDRASAGIRFGSQGDRLEELASLRVQAQCRWAMNEREEARALLLKLQAQHHAFEFGGERRRVQAVMAELGIGGASAEPVTSVAPAPRRRSRVAPEPVTLALADGREFVTLDHELVRQIRRAAASELPVLIEGQTGTGKELVSRLVHELGPRAAGPFVVADCSTLPDGLVESELFGAARGAYSGAIEARPGIVAQSDGGTLFLDELPELSLAAQAKLLRLIQDGGYRRVGEANPRHVRTRFIAATNRAVAEALAQRALKPDLYHRLNGHRIQLRPLAERRDEIAVIARHVAVRAGAAGISDDAVHYLERLPWPGNVRELEMAVRVAAASLPAGEPLALPHFGPMDDREPDAARGGGLRGQRLHAERVALEDALRRSGGRVATAARALGMSRQAFYKAMKRAGMSDAADE